MAYKNPLCGPCETNALSRGDLIAKRFTMVDGLCAIQNLQRRSAGGGSYSEGGLICQFIRYDKTDFLTATHCV